MSHFFVLASDPFLQHADFLQDPTRSRAPGQVVRVNSVQFQLVKTESDCSGRRFGAVTPPPLWIAYPVAQLCSRKKPVKS